MKPLLKQHIFYLNLIRFDLLNDDELNGVIIKKLLSYQDEEFFRRKLIALAGSHAEVLVANELLKKIVIMRVE
ncbi:hypothetical protein EI427_23725 [Flammeovirga pectinis]|uniref:Uncharacterized protein n=1 Tax=Flammeovirga pectinis TaxID=2494373 RepID=A0A3Q9FQG9_9BACT|nr:hypothetical protein [Flammeovirga pectinis]AZQ65227.1 hypothetical protein EI427_23725 [Flammeovirga pectinis]